MEDDDSSVQDHKLCGFLYAVLRVSSSHQPHIHQSLPFATRFHIFREDLGVGFRSDDGVILLPIVSRPESVSPEQCGVVEDVRVFGSLENCGNSTPESRKRKGIVERRSTRKKKRSIGMVNGSMSVVEQLHALVSNKCLEIVARVVWVDGDDSGETRAVLLVDVYLSVALWSGWQFPRSGAIAGAFFGHLRCHSLSNFLNFFV